MKWLLAALVGLAMILSLIAIILRSKRGVSVETWPYFAKKPLTPPEQVLYFRLLKALPNHMVLAQVQLSRMLGVKKGNDYRSWLTRIHQMSADFVICAKDATVLGVVELDDSSHQNDRRKAADNKKEQALIAAGIKVIRWQARELPDSAAIRSALLPNSSAALGASPAPVRWVR